MAWATANGVETWYESAGQGTALLLIPGRGLDRRSWAPQVDCYARHFRVITYDPRGVGQTRAPHGDFDLLDLTHDARALLSTLGVHEAHVAGFSLGGIVAMNLATMSQELRVRSLMLHSTTHRVYPHWRWRQELALQILKHDDADLWALFSAFTAFGAEFINAREETAREEVRERAARWRAMTPAQKEGVRAQIRALTTQVPESLIRQIAAPTLVTVGSSDEVTRPDYAKEIAASIPGARFVVFSGGPHRVSTFMSEEFNRVTLEFLLEQERRT